MNHAHSAEGISNAPTPSFPVKGSRRKRTTGPRENQNDEVCNPGFHLGDSPEIERLHEIYQGLERINMGAYPNNLPQHLKDLQGR